MARLFDKSAEFARVTPADWHARVAEEVHVALGLAQDRPEDAPLGARAARGWLRLAQASAGREMQALRGGSEGLELDGLHADLTSLPELEPATVVLLTSNAKGVEVLDSFGARAGILHAGFDPLGALARSGHGEATWEGVLERVPAVLAAALDRQPGGRALRVDSSAWQAAGADPCLDLAASASNLLELLRTAAAGGCELGELASQLVVGVSVGPDITCAP